MYPYLGCLEILSGSISVVSIFVFLWNIHFGIAILGLLTAFPVLLISSNFEKGKFNLMKNQISRSRELDYLQGLLQSKDSIKEIRTFSLADYLLQKWKRLFFINNNEILKLNKTNQIHKIFVQVFNVLCYGFAYLIVINLLKKGALKIGNFVAIPQGVQGLQGGVTKISSNIANINSTKFYIEDYYQFINMKVPETQTEEETESFPVSIQKGIHIKNVSFSYWKSKKMVLKNVSLSIKPNEKVAIVGENGSGKSTLVKCLLGLYFVQHGNIEIDGIDIKKIDIEDLRENITALYQDYIKYDYSVHDNIAFGNVKRAKDKELVKQIASENGVDDFVRFFEKGYETRLGRLLGDGEELSGGQWQKIALARALIRDAQVVILDEPTAAFDPKSEYNFYKNFSDLTSNKIVVYISHRMSTAKLADKIVLMKDGRIVEIGSHQELINKREEYFDMYQKQYQMYG